MLFESGRMGSLRKTVDPQLYARHVREHAQEYPTLTAAVIAAPHQQGSSKESARRRLARAGVDEGSRAGVASEECDQIKRCRIAQFSLVSQAWTEPWTRTGSTSRGGPGQSLVELALRA